MPDYGARYTDKEINRVERELHGVYKQAKEELEDKLDEFYQKHKARDRMKRKQLADGKITRQEYQDWVNGQIFQREQWKRQIKQINHVLYDTNSQAVKIVNERRLDVFAENYNYFAYLGEQNPGISFELYDARSVARLIREHPQILPEWKIDEEKDYIWNAKKVNNIVTQGIIQGEGIGEIAQRLSRDLSSQNENKMLMFARTAMTGAQNAGRQQCMEDTANMGVDTHKKWVATLDRRTRDSHRHLDGQEVPYNEDFESDHGAIRYPGDPEADPAEVFNCRCTMITIFPKYEDRTRRNWREDEVIDGQTYAEWKKGKQRKSTANEPIYTQKEKDALHEYTTSTYSGINTLLREGGLSNYPQLQETVEEIDRAMAKSIIPQGTIVSRGATDADLRGLFKEHKRNWFEKYDNLKSLEGETAPFDSYLSTTRGATVAEPYKNQVEWVFEVGEGVHGIDMMPFANQGKSEVEREILFSRGQNITINKVDCNEDDDGDIYGIITIHATIKRKKVKT